MQSWAIQVLEIKISNYCVADLEFQDGTSYSDDLTCAIGTWDEILFCAERISRV
jgi:hypothetical protein